MQTRKNLFSRILIFVLLAIILLGVTGLVLADNPDPSTGGQAQQAVVQSPPGSTADEPEGYVPQQQAAPDTADPASVGAALAPVENSPAGSLSDEQNSAMPSSQAPTTAYVNSYLSVTGNALRPSNSTSTYSYVSWGCMSSPSGSFTAPIQLPEGSVIKYLRIYYNNSVGTSSQTSTGWIYRYDPMGSGTSIAVVTTRPGTTTGVGYQTDLSAPASYTVNNLNEAYVFIWNSGGSDQALCGFRINYDRPLVPSVALPFIVK